MNPSPAIILLADDQSARLPPLSGDGLAAGSQAIMEMYSPISTLIRKVQATGLPMMLVAPAALSEAVAHMLPPDQRLPVMAPSIIMQRSDWLVRGMASGVLACSRATGWIVLPVDMPMVQGNTILELANALQQSPVAYPCHGHQRGHPVAFSSELFSELVQLSNEQDLRRLVARYPAVEVVVDDPGIHMAVGAHAGLDQWRAQLGTYSTPQTMAYSHFTDLMS